VAKIEIALPAEITAQRAEEMLAGARAAIPDRIVSRALVAYESMPAGTGREDRMRVAIRAVQRKMPAGEPELEGNSQDG
jgi:hypothetical protein